MGWGCLVLFGFGFGLSFPRVKLNLANVAQSFLLQRDASTKLYRRWRLVANWRPCGERAKKPRKNHRRHFLPFFICETSFHIHNLPHVIHNTMSAFTVTSALAARVAAPKAARSARRSTVVRAAEEPVAPVVDATEEPVVPPAPVKPTSFTLQQAFAFNGPEGSNFIASGPELMNGRLAMLAFVAAAGAEISTGETVMQQFSEAPTAVLLTTALFVAATLKTFTTNTISDTIGPFTKEKELLNGRAAMVGMACLLGFEAVKHHALL